MELEAALARGQWQVASWSLRDREPAIDSSRRRDRREFDRGLRVGVAGADLVEVEARPRSDGGTRGREPA